jgi:hypothetical protein
MDSTPCDFAFHPQAEAYARRHKLQLIGYYHAESRMNAQDIHPVGKRIADKLAERQPDSFVLALNNQKLAAFSRQGSTEAPFDLMLRESSAAKGSWKKVPAGSTAGSLAVAAGSSWEQLRARFLNMHGKGQHAQLADFDEHLDDISKDYTNQQLFSQATGLLER